MGIIFVLVSAIRGFCTYAGFGKLSCYCISLTGRKGRKSTQVHCHKSLLLFEEMRGAGP